ncbi:MAG: vanadium-dependent haloperoxidase [Bacteroidota bacterium]
MKESQQRKQDALAARQEAAQIAYDREHPHGHQDNGDERRYVDAEGEKTYLMSFTKGLKHNPKTGLVNDPSHYRLFVKGIDSGDPEDFENTPIGPGFVVSDHPDSECKADPKWTSDKANTGKEGKPVEIRAWESSSAGLTFDLQGPDAQAVEMPPAPALDSNELTGEIGEVYAQALLRDIPLATFYTKAEAYTNEGYQTYANKLIALLNKLPDFSNKSHWKYEQGSASRGCFNLDTVFRGVTPGEQVGPYLSQFLLMGNTGLNSMDMEHRAADGYITYGSLRIDQRVRTAKPHVDYMQQWDEWLDVQNGANLGGLEQYVQDGDVTKSLKKRRFITTGRDLATYVHYDALYEAYLNACLMLLAAKSEGTRFDLGIPFQARDLFDRQQGFAHFGGPHILTLVTEVATRALKAVRFQKFNVHRRLRPEALAARIQMSEKIAELCITSRYGSDTHRIPLVSTVSDLEDILTEVNQFNTNKKKKITSFKESYEAANPGTICDIDHNHLLPMAFCEGSPMHPSYGAGHATVAGACVTILKAFFNTNQYLAIEKDGSKFSLTPDKEKSKHAFVAQSDGLALKTVDTHPLSLGGELNKLAANISIGRNWAGVHYYSDYLESIKMGEEIAIGILQEQSITYNPPENVSMTLDKFDGSQVVIKHGKVIPSEKAPIPYYQRSDNGKVPEEEPKEPVA